MNLLDVVTSAFLAFNIGFFLGSGKIEHVVKMRIAAE